MRASSTSKIPKSLKRATGRGEVRETPLHIRTFATTPRTASSRAGLGDYVRMKLGRKLGKFAHAIERVSVRFEDVNGPRGGVDAVSRIKVVLSERPSVVVEARGVDACQAFDQASHRTERSVRRSLGRTDGATDRKAGGGSTAARNVKRRTSRATAALEDSATGRPSRKSTRASANRAKSGSKQGRRAKAAASSPKRAATKAKARASRPRG
jgi:hypothetical protein